jgi:hypothetical protein
MAFRLSFSFPAKRGAARQSGEQKKVTLISVFGKKMSQKISPACRSPPSPNSIRVDLFCCQG